MAAWMACWSISAAGIDTRSQEINDCRNGEIVLWDDGKDHPAASSVLLFAYNPTNAPLRFPEYLVADKIATAANAWSKCGISTRLVARADAARMPNVIWVQWDEAASGGNFGLSNLGNRTLSLSAKAFDVLNARNPTHDATLTLQMVISHEMGHHLGLIAHSRRCVDVLSYYDNGKGEQCFKRSPPDSGRIVEYRHTLPTACDIARCRAINGK